MIYRLRFFSLPHLYPLPSLTGVSAISQDVKDLYKTVWEIKQKAIIDQAADRGTRHDTLASLLHILCNVMSCHVMSCHVKPRSDMDKE